MPLYRRHLLVGDLASDAEARTGTATDKAVTPANLAALFGSGFISAEAFTPTETNGAARFVAELTSNDVMLTGLAFDQTTAEHATLLTMVPLDHNAGDGFTVTFFWTTQSGGASETVDWRVAVEVLGDSSAIDQAYGSNVDTLDTWITDNDVHISSVSATVSAGNTETPGEMLSIKVSRDVSTDDLGGDAILLGVKIDW